MRRLAGFTLVEMVITIVVAGIVAVMVATIMGNQASGYVDMRTRAELVQQAAVVFNRMATDIQYAVPNSVRVSGNYLELVPIVHMGHYREKIAVDGSGDILDFSIADGSFDVFADWVTADTAYADAQAIVYNLGMTGSDLYDNATGVVSPPGLEVVDGGEEDQVVLDVPHQFSASSPQQKVYIARGALTYHCSPNPGNPSAGSINRYWGYALQAAQPVNAAAAPLSAAQSALASLQVEACSFRYTIGSLARNAVVSIELTLSEGGQSITLMKQVHIANIP